MLNVSCQGSRSRMVHAGDEWKAYQHSHPVECSTSSVHKDPRDLVAVMTLGRGRCSV